MNRIFVTGDIHGGIDKDKITNFYQEMSDLDLTDIMIVAGDWGYIWSLDPEKESERAEKNELSSKMTYFVVLGNHENYDRIEKLPTTTKFGNTVRFEPEHPNIFYAQNGKFYDIYGKSFWCMGGGFSIDKGWRTPKVSWWEQEVPQKSELDAILANFLLELHRENFSLQYIITHTCPFDLQPFDKFIRLPPDLEVDNTLEKMLQEVWNALPATKPSWYCGHFHLDEQREIHFLYNQIEQIK